MVVTLRQVVRLMCKFKTQNYEKDINDNFCGTII